MIARFRSPTKAAVLLALSFPQLAAAEGEGFTSAAVLEWSEEQQLSLLRSSVTMIALVAMQRDDTNHIARCLDTWFEEGRMQTKLDGFRDAMTRYPDHHPQGIIMVLVEKECGKFSEA